MHANAQEIFVCPGCRGSLRLHASESVIIETGTLECSSCGAVYPVRRGVPRFVSTESYADTFGRQWTRWARTQHDSLNETTIFRGRMQRYTGWTPESMSGKVVVDAGCGPGGFIDVIEEHAKLVIGFDLSCAIDAAYELHGRRPNVHLAQADIFRSPLPDGVADRVYTFGVVQHTEDPESAFRMPDPARSSGRRDRGMGLSALAHPSALVPCSAIYRGNERAACHAVHRVVRAEGIPGERYGGPRSRARSVFAPTDPSGRLSRPKRRTQAAQLGADVRVGADGYSRYAHHPVHVSTAVGGFAALDARSRRRATSDAVRDGRRRDEAGVNVFACACSSFSGSTACPGGWRDEDRVLRDSDGLRMQSCAA